MNTPEKVEEYWKVEGGYEGGWWSRTDMLYSLASAQAALKEARNERIAGWKYRIVRYETTKTVVE